MSLVEIRRAVFRDVCFVAAHMRDADSREIYCQLAPEATSVDVAALSFAGTDHAWCAWARRSPVAAFGFTPATLTGTVWSAWAFGTRRFTRAVPAITRFITECAAPLLIEAGARRIEARSIADHDLAHGWMQRLGARREAVLNEWGRDGETFILWSWTRNDWRNRNVHQGKDPESTLNTQCADATRS